MYSFLCGERYCRFSTPRFSEVRFLFVSSRFYLFWLKLGTLLEANISEKRKLVLWSQRPPSLQDKLPSQYFQSFGLETKNSLVSSLNLVHTRHVLVSVPGLSQDQWPEALQTTIKKSNPVSSEVLAPSLCFASTF